METKLELNLQGKTALVTGSSGELGRVIARTLARCGASLVLHYHGQAAKAQALADELEARGSSCFLVQADVASSSSVRTMAQTVLEHFGTVDIVVANAVAQYTWKPLLEQDEEDYRSQFDTCVMQTVHLAKAFAPAMAERSWGRYIAINTECAMQCFPGQSAYVAGKRGLDGLVRTLAKELGPKGITVNQVAPGWTISERDRLAGTEKQAEYDQKVPLGHRGTDQDVANAVAFLASDLAGFITGTYLPVSGGNVMPGI